MIRYAAGRVLQGLLVILAVVTLTFIIIHLAPGDPLAAAGDSRFASPEVIAQTRRNFGLDRPLGEQYVRYVASVVRGDLGISFSQHRPVRQVLADVVPNTLILGAAALLVDFVVGIGLGLFQGARAGTRADKWLSLATLTLYSIPIFWLGLIVLVVFGQQLHWLPAGGMRDLVQAPLQGPLAATIDVLRHLVLPALTLGLVGAAATARYQRAALLDVLRQDYVRTARAKGLPDRAVLLLHAARTALLPVITLFGLSLPVLLSGAVLVETVFAWPGLGRLSALAIFERDYPVVTAAAMLAAAMVVAGNVVADLLYRAADPRVETTA